MIPALRLRTDQASRVDDALVWTAIGLACVALAARQVGSAALAVTVGVGAVGLIMPVRPERSVEWAPTWWRRLAPMAIGIAAFLVARQLLDLPSQPLLAYPLAGNVVAAFAEEAFFRRLMFGRLLRWGPLMAVAGTALLFALVHVPAYGWMAFPVDLAAGGLLGWQRRTTGSWIVPGATHAIANVLQMI